MLHQSLLRRAITVGLLFLITVLCPLRTVSAVDSAEYFATSSPIHGIHTCTQSDPCDLQNAVNQAADGDTIYVAGGTYTSTASEVLLLTKSVTIQGGWNGLSGRVIVVRPTIYPTILDGQDTRRVVNISGNVSPTLSGLTIQNGRVAAGQGGGVNISNASGNVTIDNCTLHSNYAEWYGGGVALLGGALTVTRSTIYDNRTTYGGGAFMVSMGTSLILENSVAYQSSAQEIAQYGTFIHADRGGVTLRRNHIAHHADSSSLISVSASSGGASLENNIFEQNAGKVFEQSGAGELPVFIQHNTFTDNGVGAINLGPSAQGEIANNIFTGQTGYSIQSLGGSSVNVHHNLFWQNGQNPILGSGAVQADPKFTVTYHLNPGSPAIDAGAPSLLTVDYDGDPRSMGSAPDIGADEVYKFVYLPMIRRD